MSSSRTKASEGGGGGGAGGATLVDVTMPQMGVSVAEGTVVAWRFEVGDRVQADETICEITTDKIDTEVPSPASGVLAEILVPVETTVEVGTPLARIALSAGSEAATAESGNGDGASEAGVVAPEPGLAPGPGPEASDDSVTPSTPLHLLRSLAPPPPPLPSASPPPPPMHLIPVCRGVATAPQRQRGRLRGAGGDTPPLSSG